MAIEEMTYARGELSVEQLQKEVARFWTDAAESTQLQDELTNAGLTEGVFDYTELAKQIEIRAGSSGAGPESVILIVALAPTANSVLKDIWKDIILPRVRRRWGDDALGGEQHGNNI